MDKNVSQVINSYPEPAKKAVLTLRELIIKQYEIEGIDDWYETLKWGEPSFLNKLGTTVRFAFNEKKHPHHVQLLVNCKSSLIECFKTLYGDHLEFEGKRAINLPLTEPWNTDMISHCLLLVITYQQRKHLPLLGC